MGYQDYTTLLELLDDLEDIADMLASEGEPARRLEDYLAERVRLLGTQSPAATHGEDTP
jgi:hypothetical protein